MTLILGHFFFFIYFIYIESILFFHRLPIKTYQNIIGIQNIYKILGRRINYPYFRNKKCIPKFLAFFSKEDFFH